MKKFQTCLDENRISLRNQILDCLEKGLNEEAKSVLQKVENICQLTDTSDLTLLHHSVKFENAEMTQYLIDKGCNVNAQDGSGITPLMLSVGVCDEMTVEILLKNDADIYLTDYDGESSLEKAVRSKFKSPIGYLQATAHLIIEMFFTTVNDDFSKGRLTEFLLAANDVLKLAVVVFGSAEITKFVLKNCPSIIDFPDPRSKRTALHFAIVMAKLENSKILIEHGASMEALDGYGASPLFYYIQNCEDIDEKSEILEKFLSTSTSLSTPDTSGYTDVELLLSRGNEKTVRAVLLSGIDVDVCYNQGRSLLFALANNQKIDSLELLTELNVKYNVNTTDEEGITPLMSVAYLGMAKTVEFLLRHGADVNWTCWAYGCSALSFVDDNSSDPDKASNAATVVELLLQYGIDAQSYFDDPPEFDDEPSRADSFSLSTQVIVAQFAMLEALDASLLTESPRDTIESTPRLKTYFDLCTQQLEEMKAFEVYGIVTLFDLLTENEEKIVGYARNRELFAIWSSALESLTHFEAYYSNTLRRRLSHASDEAELRKKVALTIDALTGLCSDVYHSIVYKIIRHLDRQDLYNLCEIDNIFRSE